MSLVLAAISKQDIFFQILFKTCKMYLCSSILSQILLKNTFVESGFSNSRDFFSRNDNSFFGHHFETKHFSIVLFADIWLLLMYTHTVTETATEKYSKMNGSDWTPLMHKREWKVAYALKW